VALMDEEPFIDIEHVQEEVHASMDRARELLCEAKLELRQRSTPSAFDPLASTSPASQPPSEPLRIVVRL
jgi:hypothetical protein